MDVIKKKRNDRKIRARNKGGIKELIGMFGGDGDRKGPLDGTDDERKVKVVGKGTVIDLGLGK